MALNTKQRVFVEEYLRCWNAAEAGRRAGYSPGSLTHVSYRNLRNPEIRALIEERIAEVAMRADEVLLRLAEQARGSLGDFLQVTEDGGLAVDLQTPTAQEKLHLIKKLKVRASGVEIELYDAQSALVHLGKHLGLFREQVEVDWRGELREAGIDDQALFDYLVAGYLAGLLGNPGSAAGAGDEAGADSGGGDTP